jgi:thiol-disulfide isomerase/thioredoxin
VGFSSSWRGSTCSRWRAERANCSHWRARRAGLLLAALLLAGTAEAARASSSPLPAIWLSDLQGGRAPLDSLLGGQPTLLLFWSTPCQSCLETLRAVEAFAAERAGQGLALLMVNIDAPRNKNQIAPFLHRFGFKAPTAIDPDRDAFRKLGGREAPFLVFISAEREILHRSGVLDRQDLTAIAALLDVPVREAVRHE